MTIWITQDIPLTEPLVFVRKEQNVVILANITSNFDITFKVKNLIVLGRIITSGQITLKTQSDCFHSGILDGTKISIISKNKFYKGIDERAIEKIRSLGIDISLASDGSFNYRISKD